MTNIIIKPERDKDFYVMWSTITDFPICWGRRKDFIKWSKKPRYAFLMREDIEKRLSRADENSCSAQFEEFKWDNNYEILYGDYGYIYRSEVLVLINFLTKNKLNYNDPEVSYIVHPVLDDAE